MKRSILCFLMLIGAFAACKKTNVSPPISAKQALVIGNWKWSAEYDNTPGGAYVLTPGNTGVQETLVLNPNYSWTQIRNGVIANTGTYSLPGLITPLGTTVTVLSFVNSKVTDTARYDNFDFNTGFQCSYYASKDSLVFFGADTINTVSYVGERVYIK